MKNPYETAYQIAQKKLASLDLADVAFNSSASLSKVTTESREGDDGLTVTFLGETFQIAEKGKQIKCLTDNREAKIAEKIILLHYLTTADGMPLSRETITFSRMRQPPVDSPRDSEATLLGRVHSGENLSGANFYYPTYKARTIDLLLRTFKNTIKRFLAICNQLGAKIESAERQGKATFLILPNVPVNFIYWSGDKELSPNVQILYDANITHYLPLEDIIVVTELLTHKIIRRAKETKPGDSALYDYH